MYFDNIMLWIFILTYLKNTSVIPHLSLEGAYIPIVPLFENCGSRGNYKGKIHKQAKLCAEGTQPVCLGFLEVELTSELHMMCLRNPSVIKLDDTYAAEQTC